MYGKLLKEESNLQSRMLPPFFQARTYWEAVREAENFYDGRKFHLLTVKYINEEIFV